MTDTQKIDKILDSVTDMKIELARSVVHLEQQQFKIKQLEDYRHRDEKFKNKAVGGLAVINVILVAVGTWIAKHL